MPNEFEIKDLRLKYGFGDLVLNGIDTEIKQGELTILLGQNGSGKSSVMRCLAGLEHWTSGEIFRKGRSRQDDIPNFNEGLMMISEDIVLPSEPLQILARIYREIWGKFDEAVFDRLLSYGRIAIDKKPAALSRGQKALAQFALARAAEIPTLLVDEITAVLDPYVRNRLVAEFVDYQRRQGATLVIATNIASEFAGVDARVLLLDGGRIYLEGGTEEISREFIKFENVGDEFRDSRFVVLPTKYGESLRLIARQQDVADTTRRSKEPATLEEVFIYLSGKGKA